MDTYVRGRVCVCASVCAAGGVEMDTGQTTDQKEERGFCR